MGEEGETEADGEGELFRAGISTQWLTQSDTGGWVGVSGPGSTGLNTPKSPLSHCIPQLTQSQGLGAKKELGRDHVRANLVLSNWHTLRPFCGKHNNPSTQ